MFGITAAAAGITHNITGYGGGFSAVQWGTTFVVAVLNLAAACIAGVYFSAVSPDMRRVNAKASMVAYPLGLLLIVYLNAEAAEPRIAGVLTGAAVSVICLAVFVAFAVKASSISRARHFEPGKVKTKTAKNKRRDTRTKPISQYGAVIRHEIRYFLTLRRELVFIGMYCVCPALIACPLVYRMGYVDLNLAVLAAAAFITTPVRNVMSYSIGGEKAFKTGEPLLSAPVSVRTVFLAKCTVPVALGTILITLSSALVLIGANITGYFVEFGKSYMFTPAQFVLLFPASILTCIAFTLFTGILSIRMKTPRSGLYAASLTSLALIIPLSLIIYASQDMMFWALWYCAILVVISAFFIRAVSGNISRQKLMEGL